MLVREWMTDKVISITENTSMMKASRLMKDNDIHRLPVVDGAGRVVGIVSDRDIKEASPSKATTLDMHELYYLLSELKVKDIMTKDPVCVQPEDSVETAALVMIENHIGGMPVVDENNKLKGVITDSDIFKVLISITGAQKPGLQLAFELSTAPGTLRPILDALREHEARVVSVLTAQNEDDENLRRVYIRVQRMEKAKENRMLDDMKKRFSLLYWTMGGPKIQ